MEDKTVIDYETFIRIQLLKTEKKLRISQIAVELDIDRRTVMNALRRKNFQPRVRGKRSSMLDPYKEHIKSELARHDYSAVQVYQRLKADGYTGRYGIVRDYVRLIRPKHAPAYLSLSFAPGECAQVDWGEYGTVRVGSTSRKLSFFSMVLCYSRMMYVEFSVRQTTEHFLSCHQNAFEFFGGVPARLMIDNLKSAVLKHIAGEAAVFSPRYLDFANYYGYTISACAVRKGNEKGRVEKSVDYIKRNLLRGLDIGDYSTLQPVARDWMDNIANVRIHGVTKKQPINLYPEDKAALQPMPLAPYDIGSVRVMRSSSQFRIAFETNRYSVPAEYASQLVTVKSYPDRLCIYADGNLIANHPRSYDRHLDFENPDHPRALLAERKNARDQKLHARFLCFGPRAAEYYQKLKEKRLNPVIHLRKVIALSEIYGQEAVARAIEDAFVFDAFSSEYIANILESRARILPAAAPLQLMRNEDLLELEIDEPDLNIYNNSHNQLEDEFS